MIFEICAIVATVIFLIVAIFLVITLIQLKRSLKNLDKVVAKVETQVNPLTLETLKLLQNSNNLTESLQDQLSEFDPLLESVHHIGSALQDATHYLNPEPSHRKGRHHVAEQDWPEKASDLIELVSLGLAAWQKINKRR